MNSFHNSNNVSLNGFLILSSHLHPALLNSECDAQDMHAWESKKHTHIFGRNTSREQTTNYTYAYIE